MTTLPPDLIAEKNVIREYALDYGLDFFETFFEILDFDQLNEIAAYGGFPNRYPHWRHGMQFEELMKGYQYGLSKIYELVINNDPCYAYLMRSNSQLDQKLVMAHVYGHSDFFKNNLWFDKTNRKMMDQMANHGTRARRLIDRHGLEPVETFLDACLSLENLIDIHSVAIRRSRPVTEEEIERDEIEAPGRVKKIESKDYMDRFINPPEFLEAQRQRLRQEVERKKRFPPEPARDVLLFLIQHGERLKSWERDILSMIREEAYYFAPQAMTKVMNEGWACVTGETRVVTDRGLLEMREIVDRRLPVRVFDGERMRRVVDWARFPSRDTVRIRTARGFVLEGSTTHRVLTADGTWRRLDEIGVGEEVGLARGERAWPSRRVRISWTPRERPTLEDVAREAGVHVRTLIRHRDGEVRSRSAEAIDAALAVYEREREELGPRRRGRTPVRVPETVDRRFARFLGLLLSDGNVSDVKRVVSFTSGDRTLADEFAEAARMLFALEPLLVKDGSRWRVHLYSKDLIDLLADLGVPSGPAASRKAIPECVLRSPRTVVAAFLSGLFDGDGHAGRWGIIYSTASAELSRRLQEVLLSFGVLSSRRRQRDGCWRVYVFGRSAAVFREEIGFGLPRKAEALAGYVDGHEWYKDESEADRVVSVERDRADVYDVTVEGSHRYVASGLVNHNSFWHSKIMTEKALTDAEVVDFADRHAGTLATAPGQINPYKLGIELFRDIEERWNQGKFGKEWEEEDDYEKKVTWDTGAGLGRQKIFEVRKIYNDVTFLDTFLTEEFCEAQKLFVYGVNPRTGQREIVSRDWLLVKDQLLSAFTNRGQPVIEVLDGNHRNRGELYLIHRYDGKDLRLDFAQETLKNLFIVWKRPVHVETVVEGKGRLISFDGERVSTEDVTPSGA